MKKYFPLILACVTQQLFAIPDATEAAFRSRAPKCGTYHAHSPEIKESSIGWGNLQVPHLAKNSGSSLVIGVPRNIAHLLLSVQQFVSSGNVTPDVDLFVQIAARGTEEKNSLFLADWAFPLAKKSNYEATADAEVTFFNSKGIRCESLQGSVSMDTESWGGTTVSQDGVPLPRSIVNDFKQHDGGTFYAVGKVTYPTGKQRSFITLIGASNAASNLVHYIKNAHIMLGRTPQINDLFKLMQEGKKHIGSAGIPQDELMMIYDAAAMLGYVDPQHASRYAKLGTISAAKKQTSFASPVKSNALPTSKTSVASKKVVTRKKLTPAQLRALRIKTLKLKKAKKLTPAQVKALKAKTLKAKAKKK